MIRLFSLIAYLSFSPRTINRLKSLDEFSLGGPIAFVRFSTLLIMVSVDGRHFSARRDIKVLP